MMPGKLRYLSPGFKLLILFLMMLFSAALVSLFVGFLGWKMYGTFDVDTAMLSSDIGLLKMLQLVQTVFIFILPSAVAAFLFYSAPFGELYGTNHLKVKVLFVAALTIFVSQYFISWAGYVNSRIVFPEGWGALSRWIEQTEREAVDLTLKLVSSHSVKDFLVNTLIIAVIPAIGEEWLFRGNVQRYLGEWFKNMHLSVLVTSVLFAALHLQFMTFLPRFFLGLILGYLFYFGGNLWYSVAGHFTNNFLALLMMRENGVEQGSLNAMEMQPEIHFSAGVMFSLLGVVALLFLVSRAGLEEKRRKGRISF